MKGPTMNRAFLFQAHFSGVCLIVQGVIHYRCRLRYSVLRAFIGEIDAARLAGIMAAKNAQMASALVATASASGSQMETP